MKLNWNGVTRENVIEAIKMFEESAENYPPARNTFLEYNGKRYPAKHIRALSYKSAFGFEAPKSEFTGGAETVRFFEKLEFHVKYTPRNDNDHDTDITEAVAPEKAKLEPQRELTFTPTAPATSTAKIVESDSDKAGPVKIPSKNVIEQKNALQLVLNRYFNGDVVSEKTFDWMTTPIDDREYPYLVPALHAYRGRIGFDKRGYKLRCDFVCESQKLIIEYDERQHFSLARKAALESYPSDLTLYFDKQKWISACESIQAKDSDPPNRDEIRAYYDSIRDIRSVQNGYRLIRIMHGTYDWESPDASEYINTLIEVPQKVVEPNQPAVSLKIGLYLQGNDDHNKRIFNKRLNDAARESLDIFVFPETCYTPSTADFYDLRLSDSYDVNKAIERAMKISRQAGCAVIIGAEDKESFIYNIYANAYASGNETTHRLYRKHTMADNSLLSSSDYKDTLEDIFNPIILKNVRIGMTICYDSNHAAFSRAWGKRGVDIIINSTGGNVVHQKWYRYNKTRSLENNCFSFCTMGYSHSDKINSYTFGFTPNGALLTGKPIYPVKTDKDMVNNIYVYDTSDFDGRYEPDISIEQAATPNATGTWSISPNAGRISVLLKASECITDGLYRYTIDGNNVIFCCIDSVDIKTPDKVLRLLYHPELKGIPNKRYLIINRWPVHDDGQFDNIYSDILKVRTVENFCAVLYTSPEKSMCFQAGKNKNVQSVMLIDGEYRLDFTRMSGPEAIWKNKDGMRANWRCGYETLVCSLTEAKEMKQVALISCTKDKRSTECEARYLYDASALFRKAYAYAQLVTDESYVLSAKYGLVEMSTVIAPYDETLNTKSSKECMAWGNRVMEQIGARFDISNTEFILLAGEKYIAPLLPYLDHCKQPLKGLPMGVRMQRLDELVRGKKQESN
ncbi:hypothetical protein C1I38_00860 [Dehalobacter sp. 12DCB1]|uniref:carbon-nitrogen hydrolase family protein n=1 Tax=unclassified Dehalobacter TaxID=2635733 RepID=UPI000E6B8FD6|nr:MULTISPECIES: carbon-nitrogen hydrolase family protein [unclassified Dehalobacter]TCX56100.1 hypothetical protein C1I38_00860 [Dehalobacter sp. 12DCB1]